MLNPRATRILNKLFLEETYITIDKLADITNSSNRSVRYNLQKIDLFLLKNQLYPLQRHHKKGAKLYKDQKTELFLREYFNQVSPYKRVFSKEEIYLFILLNLLIYQKEIPISFFETTLNISRTSILNTLNDIKINLKKLDLELNWSKWKGLVVTGNEHVRTLEFVNIFCKKTNIIDFYNYIELGSLPAGYEGLLFRHLFKKKDLENIHGLILLLEKELNCIYDDRSFLILIIYFIRLINRSNIELNGLNIFSGQTQVDNHLYQISKTVLTIMKDRYLQIIIDKNEITYLMSLLSSLKIVKSYQKFSEDHLLLVDKLMSSVENIYQIKFEENSRELKNLLLLHIEPMLNRIRFHIQLENPLHEEIVKKHRGLFNNIKKICGEIAKEKGFPINDHEISYLTIYFATMIEKVKKVETRPRVLVICVEGVAISKYVAVTIQKLFNINQVETLPVREINDSIISNYDLVITTVEIPYLEKDKVIKVSSTISKEDIENLKKHLNLCFNKKTENNVAKIERFIKVIKNSCEIKDLYKLQYDLLLELINEQEVESNHQMDLLQLHFSKENIKLQDSASDWKEAIYKGSKILEEKGLVKKSYGQKIIQNLEEYGPYMSIAPKVVLAHAGPNDGVIENSLSVLILNNGVNFKDRFNIPVSIIITLALKETCGHLNIAEEIIKLAQNENIIEKIITSRSKGEIFNILLRHLNIEYNIAV